ncbi:MAG: transglycosylase SLT domain-containing protein [Bacteroidales bacterium]|nr:transglycosylase SLT domain-containing protein [Bacteroidales bacterium]
MRKIVTILVLCKIASLGFAQDTIEQAPVTTFSEISDSAVISDYIEQDSVKILPLTLHVSQESFLTRHLRYFDKRFDVTEIVEEDLNYEPLYENVDSIFQERLNQINTLMHLPYNPRVRAYIEVYTSRKRNQTRTMLMLSRYYFPIFERELAKHGLPEELKYLAIIESALNPRAVSRVGASGLWQFMYRTGKSLGLRVNNELDERFDPEKSTEAAVLYLKSLYNRFGCWTLAIAAYNSGQGTVNRAITRAKGKRDFWEIYKFLPRETRNYVPAFIGATYAMTYYREHNIIPSDTDFPEIMDTLMINQKVYFDRIAHFTGVPIQTIRDHNPQYKLDFIPEDKEPFVLRLPAIYILRFIENSDTIFTSPIPENVRHAIELLAGNQSSRGASKVTYRVKHGDNLSSIAARFGVRVSQLKEWNNLKSDLLKINQNLVIYTTKPNHQTGNVAALQSKNTSTTDGKFVHHKVQKGETLFSIQRKHPGSTIQDIINLNNLSDSGSRIYPNQVLKIRVN